MQYALGGLNNNISVSYTHLDVYKRQAINEADLTDIIKNIQNENTTKA